MFRIPGVATIRGGGAGGGRISGSGILHSTCCRPFILSSTSKPTTTTTRTTRTLSHRPLFSPLSSSCSSFSIFSCNFHFRQQPQPQRKQRQQWRQRQAEVASPPPSSSAAAAAAVSWYTSRAHPKPTPEYGIKDGLASVLRDVEERKIKREERWERNEEKRRLRKGAEDDDGPYRNQDETIELALNLNLDPRKPGQALRGTVPLPHGTGRTKRIIVFTSSSSSVDDNIKDELEKAGAALVGDETLIRQIQGGDVSIDTFDVAIATPDIMPKLSAAARILGPRGLMPNAKTDTIRPADKLVDAVREQSVGSVQYRTDKEGIVHAGLAKASFGSDKILDNIKTFMNEMLDVKPESFGKGKKKGGGGGGGSKKRGGGGKKAKYFLKAHLTATQGKGLRIDLRTVDPTSTYFMGSVPE